MYRNPIRLITASALIGLAAMVGPAAVSAQPVPAFVATFECSDGNSYDINFGAPKNYGSVGFVLDSNVLLVGKTFTAVADGQVIESISWVRGIEGFDDANLVTCTADLGFISFTLVGWLSPRAP